MKDNTIFGIIGSTLGVIGTAVQVDDILKIISAIITIIGGIITWFVIPLITWYNKSKRDGKIDKDEIKEAIDIIDEGTKHLKENEKKGENDEQN